MADAGTRYTDAAMREMERRFRAIYREAQEDIIEKLNAHTQALYAKDAAKRAQVAAGTLSEHDYQNWLNGQVFIGKQWKDKVDSVATSLLYANQQANAIVEGKKRAVFGENATFQAYSLEHDAGMDLSFGVYDSATVTNLIREQPELLPRKKVDANKDKGWNQEKIANCITQGVIQGESIPQIAQRIARDTASSNEKAMTRYARTAMTGAQNAGRMEMLHEAQDMGIKVKKKWLATLDSRTRDAHANLDGQVQNVDDPFKSDLGDIMYPGDFSARPANVWNCRCGMTYVYPEYPERKSERTAYVEYIDDNGKYHRESYNSPNVTYNVWKLAKDKNNQRALEQWRTYNDGRQSKQTVQLKGTDKIKAIIAGHQGEWKTQELRDIGSIFHEQVGERAQSLTSAFEKELEEIQRQKALLLDEADRYDKEKYNALKLGDSKKAALYKKKADKAYDEIDKLNVRTREVRQKIKNTEGEAVRSILSDVRPVGGVDSSNVKGYADLDFYGYQKKKTKEKTIQALNNYPSEWLNQSASNKRTLKPHWTTDRAYYSPVDGEIRFSESIGTCIHELGHRFEQVNGAILKAEQEFYKERTDGLELEWLGVGYRKDEKTRKDDFVNAYMGKDYGGGAYELVSMGFQYVFTDYERFARDTDMRNWILGILSAL